MKDNSLIIPRTASRWQTLDWQNSLKAMQLPLTELLNYCGVEPTHFNLQEAACEVFTLKVAPHYLQQIKKGDKNDPLLLQVLPSSLEIEPSQDTQILNFTNDPLEEANFNPVPGLIHKYHGRVLLIANPSCAIHCRYCFRRHFNYEDNTPSSRQWLRIADYIASDASIHEVILSGGDPLSSNDKILSQLIANIAAISHVSTLRIHSRIPSVMPERITNELLTVFSQTRLKVVMVLHINHAQEISPEVAEAAGLLQQHGVRLLNQSVLLANINDTTQTLQQLFFKLHTLDIQAYYLHLLDRVKGAEHFLIDDAAAIDLYKSLQQTMPAYMLPKLAREESQQRHKTLIDLNHHPIESL